MAEHLLPLRPMQQARGARPPVCPHHDQVGTADVSLVDDLAPWRARADVHEHAHVERVVGFVRDPFDGRASALEEREGGLRPELRLGGEMENVELPPTRLLRLMAASSITRSPSGPSSAPATTMYGLGMTASEMGSMATSEGFRWRETSRPMLLRLSKRMPCRQRPSRDCLPGSPSVQCVRMMRKACAIARIEVRECLSGSSRRSARRRGARRGSSSPASPARGARRRGARAPLCDGRP